MSEQTLPFRNAVAKVKALLPPDSIDVAAWDVIYLRKHPTSEKELVDWLATAHIHFVICHPHDGTHKLLWNVENLYFELERLRHHVGFPNNYYLHCPVFRQDKYRYLELLPENCIMPTLKVPISADMDEEVIQLMVTRFMEGMPSTTRYHIKCPYTANCLGYRYWPKSREEAVKNIMRIAERNHDENDINPICSKLPYLLLQERVEQNTEVKAIFLNGQFSHLMAGSSTNVLCLTPHTQGDIVEFAKGIVDHLTTHYSPPFILDGLVRVDVFKANAGHLVVNEVESLNANYRSKKDQYNVATVDFLEGYWFRKLMELICEFLE